MRTFTEKGLGRLPVLDEDRKLVGMLTKGDITRGILMALQRDYKEEEVRRYRASHLFEDIVSERTTLVLRYTIKAGDFTQGGQASSHIKRALIRLGADPQVTRRCCIAVYEAETVSSLIVIIFSPGNELRQAQLPPPPDIAMLVLISLQAFGKFLFAFFREPAKILGLTGAILASIWIGGQYQEFVSSKAWLIPVCILGGVLISFACFPPGVYGYSEPPPSRIYIIPVFFLVAGLLAAGFTFGSWLAGRYAFMWLDSLAFIVVITLFVSASSLITSLYLFGKRNEFIRFAEKWDQVDVKSCRRRLNTCRP